MADFGGEDFEGFRTEAKTWLDENFPKTLAADPAAQIAAMGGGMEGDDARLWRERMGAKGWGVPTWPATYGGGGLSRPQARVLAEEMARIGARNPIGGMGVMMFGPTLLEYGTEALKRQHMPGIVTGSVRWCQGYSEPGSGSDLASLQTRCEDKGDHWLINGQKIWTSGANIADWCFCLVRTDTSKKHEGISFVLIDMRTPGVEVRPIKLINGTSPFCETFFTDVKAPKDQLFGPLNGGWTVAKRLLQFERDNISAGLGGGSIGAPVSALTVREAALDYVGLDQGPSAVTSIMKYAGAKIAQERNELIVESLGTAGLGWEGEGFSAPELAAVRTWLRAKANSIEGGTSEINLNVVSKRVLGLPDPR